MLLYIVTDTVLLYMVTVSLILYSDIIVQYYYITDTEKCPVASTSVLEVVLWNTGITRFAIIKSR